MTRVPPLRRFVLRSLAGALAVFALCGAIELALVLAGFRFDPVDAPIVVEVPDGSTDAGRIHRKDVATLWRPNPGARIPWGTDEHVNAQGFRGPEVARERTPGTLRIATLGDSSTFGYGVAYDETYSARLVEMLGLRLGRPVEVIDAGVIGYSVRQGLERWRTFVRDFRPDVVIGAFGAVIDHVPSMGRPDDELIRTQILGTSAFGQWKARLRRDLRLAHATAWIAESVRGGRLELEKQRWQREMLAQSQLATFGATDWTGQRRVSVDEFERFLLQLRDEVRATGAQFVALSMPRRMMVEHQSPAVLLYTRRLADLAARDEIVLVDGRRAFGQALAPGMTPRDLLVDAYHPSALGHEVLARALTETIAANAAALTLKPREQ